MDKSVNYKQLAEDILLAPARFMMYQPKTGKLPGMLGQIHEAIDPIKAFGGYGNTVGAIFGGPGAKTANMANLNALKALEGTSMTPGAKWRMTGWEKGYGPDEYLFEIPDTKAKPKWSEKLVSGGGHLEAYLDHPELFKAYPELKEFNLVLDKNRTYSGAYGHFDAKNKEIVIDPELPMDKQLSTLLHEIQHWVQAKEGWQGKGTNPGWVEHKFNQAIRKLWDNPENNVDLVRKTYDDFYKHDLAYKLYELDPGETQSRNVQWRHGLPEDFLWSEAPSQTQSAPYHKQFAIPE